MNKAKFMQFWAKVRQGLLDTIDKFSDDELDYVAVEGGFSVGQIMLHIAQEEYGEIQYGITGELDAFPPPYSQESYPTIGSIKTVLADVHRESLKLLESLEDEDLEKEIIAGWGGIYPLIDMIWHVMEHEIHHRGELSLILGTLGHEGLDA